MRVLTLIPNQTGYAPGQRSSIELWEKVLKPEGIELVYAPFETNRLREILYKSGNQLAKMTELLRAYIERLKLLKKLDEYDAVFIHREAALLGPAFLENRIAKKKPIIYQIDDPLFVPYKSPSNGYLSYLKFFGKIKEIMAISKVVVVNSSFIRDYAIQYNQAVRQIPSLIDLDDYVYQPISEEQKRICVGWSGSQTSSINVKMLESPLQQISREDLCDLHFIGATNINLKEVKYTAQKWKLETEVEDLRKMQVGLIPLADIDWNDYKFIMKSAQYMALGIIPIGTPKASNPEVIRHGENGFLATSPDEWVKYVRILADEAKLRSKMSAQAAQDAKEKYSLQAYTSQIIEIFHAAVR